MREKLIPPWRKVDQIVELTDMPQCSIGAPCPMVAAKEHEVWLAYYLQNTPQGWDGTTVRVMDPQTSQDAVALVTFNSSLAHFFGPPSEDDRHRLAAKGLLPYRVWEIKNSSWILQFEQMDARDKRYKPDYFQKYRHFVFPFHDTTFECIADSFVVTEQYGSVFELLQLAMKGPVRI